MMLITGVSGFIGGELIDLLASKNENYKWRAVSRNRTHLNGSFIINELSKNTDWEGAFDGVSCIIHLAALAHNHNYSYEDYQSVNVDGTLRLAKEAAAAGVKRFVYLSSIGVNGDFTYSSPFTPESKPSPHNSYSISKYNAELGLQKISYETGIELVIIRPPLVYGASAPGNFRTLVKLVEHSPFLPFRCVNNKRSFISVQNLVDLIVICSEHPKAPGNIFLPSDGAPVSIKDFTNAIASGLGSNHIQLPIPVNFLRFFGHIIGQSKRIEQLIGNLEVDSSRLKSVLDWNPPYSMERSIFFLKR